MAAVHLGTQDLGSDPERTRVMLAMLLQEPAYTETQDTSTYNCTFTDPDAQNCDAQKAVAAI